MEVVRRRCMRLEEGSLYEIKGAMLVPNDENDRATNHTFCLLFDMDSEVVLLESQSLTSFALSPFATVDIVEKKTQTEFLIDKVGMLTGISCERKYVKNDKEIIVLFLEITDPTGKTECALHDEYVDQVRHFLKAHGPCTPIIVVQFARIVSCGRVVFGDVAIESVPSITRVAFNPTIPEVFDMNRWLVINGVKLEGRLQYTALDTPHTSLRDEFLLYHDRRQLGQLVGGTEVASYVVSATITSLLEDEIWWFSTCKHHSCPFQGPASFTCDGHYSVTPKYNLKVEVSDGDDSTYFLLGDEDVQRLLKVSCEELLSVVQHPDDPLYPPIFERLLGENMLFLVEVQKRTSSINEGCFKVLRVCADKEIIRMFLRGHLFGLEAQVQPRQTIARLLGHADHPDSYAHPGCSSHASALPRDNFCTANSDVGEPSSSSSVSFGIIPPNPFDEHNENEP